MNEPATTTPKVGDTHGIGGSLARLGGASLISTAAQLIRAKLAALFLNPVGVGAFNQFGLLWNLICLAGSLGVTNGIIYHVARHRKDGDTDAMARLVSTTFVLTLAATLLMSLAGFVFSTEISTLIFGRDADHSLLVRLGFLFAPMGVALALNRAFLAGFKDSPLLARSQIVGDVLGTAVFAIAVIVAGLTGSIVAFLVNQAIVLVVAWRGMRKHLGGSARVRFGDVNASVLRENSGFSVSNIILIGVSNLTLLAVATAIIAADGLAQNGIFMSAFRIPGILLAAITATTLNYVLPALSEAGNDHEHAKRTNSTLEFYFLVTTPALALLVMSGSLIVPLLLSREFLAVATILALLAPAELIRIAAEATGISMLARKQLFAYSAPFLTYAALFAGLSFAWAGQYGIMGVAAAYLVGQAAHLILATAFRRAITGTFPSRTAVLFGALSLLLVTSAGAHHLGLASGPTQAIIVGCIFVAWSSYALLNDALRKSACSLMPFGLGRGAPE